MQITTKFKIILFSLCALFIQGCTGANQPNVPQQGTCADSMSREAIATLIGEFKGLEASNNLLNERINVLSNELNALKHQRPNSIAVEQPPLKTLFPKDFDSKTSKFMAKGDVNMRECPELSCNVVKTARKGETFYGSFVNDEKWVKVGDKKFISSKYMNLAK